MVVFKIMIQKCSTLLKHYYTYTDRHSLTRSMGVTAMIKFVSYLSQADISFPGGLVSPTSKTYHQNNIA